MKTFERSNLNSKPKQIKKKKKNYLKRTFYVKHRLQHRIYRKIVKLTINKELQLKLNLVRQGIS